MLNSQIHESDRNLLVGMIFFTPAPYHVQMVHKISERFVFF